MSDSYKRRIVSVIDENGVRRLVHPRLGTPELAVLRSIMTIAAETNAQHLTLEQCLPAPYGEFVDKHHAIWLRSYQGQDS